MAFAETQYGRTPDGITRPVPVSGTGATTNVPLPAGGKWSSGWIDHSMYVSLYRTALSNVASAAGGILLEYADELNAAGEAVAVFSFAPASYDTPGAINRSAFAPLGRYVRYTYTNGPVAQTTFHFSVEFQTSNVQPSAQTVANLVNDVAFAEIHKAVIEAPDSTGAWGKLQRTGGALLVSQQGPLALAPGSTVAISGTVPVSLATDATVGIRGTVPVSGSVALTNASIPVTGTVGISGTVPVSGSVTVANPVTSVTVLNPTTVPFRARAVREAAWTSGVKQADTGTGVLVGYLARNPNLAEVFLNFYDVAAANQVTVGTTVPVWTIPIPAGGTVALAVSLGYTAGLAWALTTGLVGAVVPASGLLVQVMVVR